MLRSEVAVSIANTAGLGPRFEQWAAVADVRELALGSCPHLGMLGLELPQHQLLGLIAALALERARVLRAAPRRARGPAVEGAEHAKQTRQLRIFGVDDGRKPLESVLGGEPTHLDEPVHRVRVTFELRPGCTPPERHDAYISLRREPAVQRDFELAVCPARLHRRKVEIGETDRLFQLVDESPRQKDPGEVGFDGFDRVRSVGIRIGPAQIRYLFRQLEVTIGSHRTDVRERDARVHIRISHSCRCLGMRQTGRKVVVVAYSDRIFRDRGDAGRKLGQRLAERHIGGKDVIVLGLPRGGVPVACEAAAAIGAAVDVLVVRKLGAPFNPELAVGSIASGGVIVYNRWILDRLGIDEDELEPIVERERWELARRDKAYRSGRPMPDLSGKIVVLVDDGAATGATMNAAVEAVKALGPRQVIVALPTSSREAAARLAAIADEVIALSTPEPYFAVGSWYEVFSQLSDDDVADWLARGADDRGRVEGTS